MENIDTVLQQLWRSPILQFRNSLMTRPPMQTPFDALPYAIPNFQDYAASTDLPSDR
ncbi:MAG TPA: hypothetical protein VIY08_05965 [Candidatus Nitrosocosmicus sp.]